MKKYILLLIISVLGFTVQSQEKKNKNAKYDVAVNGSCDQCKKRIEKAAFSVSGVKSADWNMDDHTLHLILNEQKSSLSDVKNAIAKVGHDTDDVKSTDADYQQLHVCCKYERN